MLALEFTTTESSFVAWASERESGDLLHLKLHQINEVASIPRYLRGQRAILAKGWIYDGSAKDRALRYGFDSKTSRAYYYHELR